MDRKLAAERRDNRGAIENIVAAVRHRLDASGFRCLSSLLRQIGQLLAADEIGIVADYPGETVVRVLRQIQPFPDVFPQLGEKVKLETVTELIRTHNRISPSNRPPVLGLNDEDQCVSIYLQPEEVTPMGTHEAHLGFWLLLVPVWPTNHWTVPTGSRHWIYVCNPRIITSAATSMRTRTVAWEVLRFGLEWFSWKHDRLTKRARLLTGNHTQLGDLVEMLTHSIVRPVFPRDYAEVLQAIARAASVSPIDQAMMAAKRWRDAVMACDPKNGRSHGNCEGCVSSSHVRLCPQLDLKVASANEVLDKLFVWMTAFWKRGTPSTLGDELKAVGIAGLREGATLLQTAAGGFPSRRFNECERFLLREFVARAVFETLECIASTSPETIGTPDLEFLSNLSSLMVVLLTDGDWTPDAIRNLIRVVAGFGHLVLKIPAELDLARHLRQTLRGESALYTLKQRYRDHFFHTIEVCLLGYLILNSCPFGVNSTDFATYLTDRLNRTATAPDLHVPSNRNDFLAQWWLASLVHDTAYGIDVLKGSLELLRYFGNETRVSEFATTIEHAIEDLHTGIRDVVPELANDTTVIRGDHGLIAAAHLSASLKRLSRPLEKFYEPAIRAVAFHNTKHPIVDGQRDPIAALLILCDTVQDWSRSQLGFEGSSTVVLSRLVSPAPAPDDEQFGPVRRFSLSLARSPYLVPGSATALTHRFVWTTSGELEICLDYAERVAKGASAIFNWVDTTFNLRRVDYSSWGVCVFIKHRVPVPNVVESGQFRLDEFERIATACEAGFAQSWIRMARSADSRLAVCHRIEESDGKYWETMTFNLEALYRANSTGTPLLGQTFRAVVDLMGEFGKERISEPKQRPPC